MFAAAALHLGGVALVPLSTRRHRPPQQPCATPASTPQTLTVHCCHNLLSLLPCAPRMLPAQPGLQAGWQAYHCRRSTSSCHAATAL